MTKKMTQVEMKKVLLDSIKGILADEGVGEKEVKKRITELGKKSYNALNAAYDGYVEKANERGKGIYIPPAPSVDEDTSARVGLQMKLDQLRNYDSGSLIAFARDVLRYHVDARQCKGDIFRAVAYKVQEYMGLGEAPRVKARQAALEDPKNIQKSIDKKETQKMEAKEKAVKAGTASTKVKGPNHMDQLRDLFKKKGTHMTLEDISESLGCGIPSVQSAISNVKNPLKCGEEGPFPLIRCKVTKLYYREDGVAPKLSPEQKAEIKAKAEKKATPKKEKATPKKEKAAPKKEAKKAALKKEAPKKEKKETPAKKPAAKKTEAKKPAKKDGKGSKK